MNKEKKLLQRIMEQITEQIRNAIEQAIDEGAKIERSESYTTLLECCYIDGVDLQKRTSDGLISVVLDFRSKKIAKVFEPSKDELEKIAEQKRAELEEIEKQINSKK